jgi:UDP-N-acetylglucosamine 2-epimerase (non-hydrolysing)
MPEEINRIVTDALADLLFTPSSDADTNLLREGVSTERIKLVGNIMIDSLMENLPKSRQSHILEQYHLDPMHFIYVTLHRPSNVDGNQSLSMIMNIMERLAKQYPVVFPIHPRTRKMLYEAGLFPKNLDHKLFLLEPIGYHGSLCLTENARLVLTDSGGLQEESTFFRTPCLTLRLNTERPITITVGSNRLTNVERLQNDIHEVLNGPERIGSIPALWDGLTADRVLSNILSA